ncbi:MAG: hypothetical protein HQL74_08075 [Magnetococcales bacterium]|nr:hypothetical protein [Magnetococcales bacterium]
MHRNVRHRSHPVGWWVLFVLANGWFSACSLADGSKEFPEIKGFHTDQTLSDPKNLEGFHAVPEDNANSFGGFETGNDEIEPGDRPAFAECRSRQSVIFWDSVGECH